MPNLPRAPRRPRSFDTAVGILASIGIVFVVIALLASAALGVAVLVSVGDLIGLVGDGGPLFGGSEFLPWF